MEAAPYPVDGISQVAGLHLSLVLKLEEVLTPMPCHVHLGSEAQTHQRP